MDKLQEGTIEYLRSRNTDQEAPAADYSKDEVTGPLSGKGAETSDHTRVVQETYVEKNRIEFIPEGAKPTRSEEYVGSSDSFRAQTLKPFLTR